MFRLLGFDVHVQSGFVFFMVLIVALNPNEFGIWLAGAISVLTLVHELGHAFAARRTGAHAEISLGFLAGYASYRPSRQLSRLEQAWISFAGPFLHISVSVAVLAAMGVNPLDRSSITDTSASQAIWWAGPLIGVLNLIPVLPLDGGNIVAVGLDRLLPGRARSSHVVFLDRCNSCRCCLHGHLGTTRGFIFFIGFLLLTQFQMLKATKPPTVAISPWQTASTSFAAGKTSKARRTLIAALSHPQPSLATAELTLSRSQADELINLLPRPMPYGDPSNEYTLANLLLLTARYDEAAHYAAGSYERHPNTLSASIVARAAAALGDQPTAIGWLRSAADIATSPGGLATTIDRAPELDAMRDHPDVASIRQRLSTTI